MYSGTQLENKMRAESVSEKNNPCFVIEYIDEIKKKEDKIMKKYVSVVVLVVLLMGWILTTGSVGVQAATTYDCNTLDVGIYWFGKSNVSQKYVQGTLNPYFDSSKPTIIYIHGWQKDTYKTLFRESFNPYKNDSSCGTDLNDADYWIDKGWNIGIFYWNQLADESEVKDAEAKIWSTAGRQGMRWRKADGSYTTTAAPTVSVGQLFANTYASVMKNFTGSEIRIAGHSLGSQVAINGSKIISDMVDAGTLSANLRPDCIALFDPFWSKNSKSFLSNQWTGAVCRTYVTSLKTKGVVFEQYKSSNINDLGIGDSNDGMKQLTCFQDLYPDFISFVNQGGKHGYARDWYFCSMGCASPVELDGSVKTGAVAASATTSTARINEMMNSAYKWIQVAGKGTATPSDDTFEKESR